MELDMKPLTGLQCPYLLFILLQLLIVVFFFYFISIHAPFYLPFFLSKSLHSLLLPSTLLHHQVSSSTFPPSYSSLLLSLLLLVRANQHCQIICWYTGIYQTHTGLTRSQSDPQTETWNLEQTKSLSSSLSSCCSSKCHFASTSPILSNFAHAKVVDRVEESSPVDVRNYRSHKDVEFSSKDLFLQGLSFVRILGCIVLVFSW